MLGRAAAEQQGDAQSFGHVAVSESIRLADFAERDGIGQPASIEAVRRQATGAKGTPSAVRSRGALGVIDRGPAANGWTRSMGYNTPRLKRAAIGKTTYIKRV